MKRLLACLLIATTVILGCSLVSCDNGEPADTNNTDGSNTAESNTDGSGTSNGGNTTDNNTNTGNTPDSITVNADGYVVVNGVVTNIRADKADVVKVDDDGYLIVNGVKTEYMADTCDHEWQTTTTAPTCTEAGYDTKTCSFCGKRVRANVVSALSHKYPTGYSTDGQYHWKKCTACDSISEKSSHSLDDDGVCTVCQLPFADTPGIVYDVASDGTYALVVGYNGASTKVKIADKYNGLPVKTVFGKAFYNNDNITAVVIPNSVTSIGDAAFYGCDSLTSVKFAENSKLTSIGEGAFRDCSSLTSVTIGNSVTSIGYSAFRDCYSLTSVTIGNSLTSIGDYAFDWCSSLTSVYITDIAKWCGISFANVYSNPLYWAENLYLNGVLVNELVIPNGVTSISSYAFYGCDSLTSVTIPDSVTSIGSCAFEGCSASLYTEYEFGTYVCTNDNPYAILIGITNKNMSSYTINANTKHIGSGVFDNCDRLTTISIPDGVTSIGDEAFYSCSNLTSVTIPDSVTSIGSYAFAECDNLKSVTFENTNGWSYSGYKYGDGEYCEGTISSSEISDPLDAANCIVGVYYQNQVYHYYTWTRS